MSIQTMLVSLSQAFLTTLAIFFLTASRGSLPLGLVVYFARKSRFSALRWLTKVYIAIMRGTPLMLQVMVVYYGPSLLLGMTLPRNWRFAAVIVAFVINYAAYFARSTAAALSRSAPDSMKRRRCSATEGGRRSSASSFRRW